MTYFTKRYHPPGTPPGTLVEVAETEKRPLQIQLFDYDDQQLTEKTLQSPAECLPYLKHPTVSWVHISGDPDTESLRELGSLYGLHDLSLEDVLNTGQRPKLDVFDDQLFIIMSLPVLHDGVLRIEQMSLFLGAGYLISFHNGLADPFELLRKRLRSHGGRLRSRGADYLLYGLLDAVIDAGFPLLEAIGNDIELLEEELLESPSKATLRRLHQLKQSLLLLRRRLWPQREVLNRLIREESALIGDNTLLYLRDCYDHTVEVMELIEAYREIATGMLDVYLSSVSNRMNEVMKVLTVIATIFIPLTFLVGIYGMNFERSDSPWAMPELHWYYGYPLVWLLMIGIALAMVVFFKRKDWF